jgi:hypothetical protein
MEFRFFSSTWSRCVWRVLAAPLCSVVHILVLIFCWFLPVFLPMVTVNLYCLKSLWDFIAIPTEKFRSKAFVLQLHFGHPVYLLHSVFGVNVVMLNVAVALIVPMIAVGWFSSHKWFQNKTNCSIFFVFGSLAVIPLGNFIHISLHRLCSETKPLYGFVVNAVCHALIEISVYISLLQKFNANPALLYSSDSTSGGGGLAIVTDRLVGSMMFNLIFIPGVSMAVGGLSYFQQTMNRLHIGTSGLLLFVSISLFSIPSLFIHFIINAYYSNLKLVLFELYRIEVFFIFVYFGLPAVYPEANC